ncbi:MAG: peptidylprolyl isomerase, partial [Actinomycetota bacterium]|nr:peptidylprolyl isomerase [Actinomycetota bacterium]
MNEKEDHGARKLQQPARDDGLPDKDYYATFRTEKGPIRIKLFADKAPETVNNFVFLAREGYFDGTTFHRVIK